MNWWSFRVNGRHCTKVDGEDVVDRATISRYVHVSSR